MSVFIQKNYVFLLIILILIIVFIFIYYIKKCPNNCPIYPVNPTNPVYPNTPINTPTNTPINTPINTPTNTPINTPTNTPTNTPDFPQNNGSSDNGSSDNGSSDNSSYSPPNSEDFSVSTKSWKNTCYVGWGMPLASGFSSFIDIAHNAGITHIILAFIQCMDYQTLTFDYSVETWANYSDSDKTMLLNKMNGYGITLMVSLGGANSFPDVSVLANGNYKYSNPKTFANDLMDWMYKNKVMAIDFDIEHLKGWIDNTKTAEYLGSLSKYVKLRGKELGRYICVSHAPQTPYFNSGAWAHVFNQIEELYGDYIDFYNIQYYNQGNVNRTYNTIFVQDDGESNAAVLQLMNANKINSSFSSAKFSTSTLTKSKSLPTSSNS